MNRIFILFIVLLLQLNLFTACERHKKAEYNLDEKEVATIRLIDGREYTGVVKMRTKERIEVVVPPSDRLEFKYSDLIIDQIDCFTQGRAPVQIAGKWGFINKEGKFAVTPIFDDVISFSEGLAAVKISGLCGYIDTSGYYVIDAKYEQATKFSEGMACVSKDDKRFIIDKAGKIKFEIDYNSFKPFSEGIAAVASNDKWGFINKEGKLNVECKFDTVFDFSEGLAAVNFEGKWGYVNKQGEFVLEPQYYLAGSFFEGKACVLLDPLIEKDINTGIFIDKTGKQCFKWRFGAAAQIIDGWAPITVFDITDQSEFETFYLLCKVETGKVIGEKFEAVGLCNEGLAPVKLNSKWGVVDTLGKWAIKPGLDSIGIFNEGYAPMYKGEIKGYIDKEGLFLSLIP